MKKGLWSYIGVLVPAAVAVISAVVILNVHSLSLNLSEKAGALNSGVNACRSIMDTYLAEGDNFAAALDGCEAVPQESGYRLALPGGKKAEIKSTAEGSVERIRVTVYSEGREVYSLETSRYKP